MLPKTLRADGYNPQGRAAERALNGTAKQAGLAALEAPTQLYPSSGNGDVKVKYGEEIFAGTDFPRDWTGFVGQDMAKRQLRANILSAKHDGRRLDHTMLASGAHGIGKTTLAHIMAFQADVGLVETTGPLDAYAAQKLILAMDDHDILFIDEAHLLISQGHAKAEWLLPFLTSGELLTEQGTVGCPDITVVAATTDAGRFRQTMLNRFLVRPRFVPYSDAEAAEIARSLANRMGVAVQDSDLTRIAQGASDNPRDMRAILTAYRDLTLEAAADGTTPDLGVALDWAGFSEDGLTRIAQEILVILLHQRQYTASLDSLGSMLSEPGPLRHHETALLQRGLISITGRGRQLTATGVARAQQLRGTI